MNKKGKILILTAIMTLVLLNLPGWGQDEEQKPGLTPPVVKIGTPAGKKELAKFHIGLRLHGGMGYVDGGDINPGQVGYLDLVAAMLPPADGIKAGGYQPLHAGINGGFDILVRLQTRWGITLGAEYLRASRSSETQFSNEDGYVVLTFAPRVSAIPLKLGLYVEKPLGKKMSLFLHGGAGYYLARFHYELSMAEPGSWSILIADTDAGAIGFHGGAALEMKLSEKLFFFIEALGRYARIDGYTGTQTRDTSTSASESYPVTVYFFNANFPEGRFPIIMPSKDIPDDPDISDIREAVVDFSGFSARAGLRIRF